MTSPVDFPSKQPETTLPVDNRAKSHHGKKHPRQTKVHETAKRKIPKAPPLERTKRKITPSVTSFKPEEQIPKQAELFKLSRQLKGQAEKTPLKSPDANRDIYITTDTVFKPGREASTKASICCGLLEINGLGETIPPAKSAEVGQVIASQDLDIDYIRVKTPKGKELIVDKNELYRFQKGYVYKEGTATYRFSKGDKPGIYVVDKEGRGHSDFDERVDDEFIIIRDPKKPKERCFVPIASRSQVRRDEAGDYVLRNGQKYRLKTEKGLIHIVGQNIQGMVQSKVANTYEGSVDIRGGVLDLRSTHPKVDEFFGRIDNTSFIDAFMATILLRPHDGKVSILNDSNYLFKALPNSTGQVDPQNPSCPLKPILIDLDEAMQSGVDNLLTGKERGIHPVRNGLMGFPQAQKKLTGADKEHAIKLIRTIIDRQKESADFLDKFKTSDHFGTDHIEAYAEVVRQLEKFLEAQGDQDFSLQDLFFHVFPNYKKQWDAIGDERPPVIKAEYIGYQSDKEIEQLINRKRA